MHILVTGGAGFIGSHLVEALLGSGHEVTVLDNLSTGRLENLTGDYRLVTGDVRDSDCVAWCMRDREVVFHLAAFTSVAASMEDPEECWDINVAGTRMLLEGACANGVGRIVLSSTSAVYPDSYDGPCSESIPPEPKTPYAESKLECEFAVRSYHKKQGLGYAALRYFNVYGPRQDEQSEYSAVIPAFISAGRKQQALTINGDGRQTRDFVYVADVVRANLMAMDSAVCGVFNVGTANAVSILSLAKTVNRLMDSGGGYVFAEPRPGDAMSSTADISLISSGLGWAPHWSLRSGLTTTIDWFRSKEEPQRG